MKDTHDAEQDAGGATGPSGRPSTDAKATASFFARVSRDLMEERAEIPTMQRIAERAVQVVHAGDHCGISLRRRRHQVQSVAGTSVLARECDELQYELGEGPCLEAVWDHGNHLTGDTSIETRWPRWTSLVAERGIGSVLSVQLATSTETLGALTLYAERKHAFDPDDVDLAVIYALHAANAMSSALLVEGLQTAVRSRHLIGIAQGILMQNYSIDTEQAFEVLRRHSSHTNIKLREVAEQVIAKRDIPGGKLTGR